MKRISLLLLLLLLISASAKTHKMIVGTYNLRYDNKGDREAGNGWDKRCRHIAHTILTEDFDILGTQEGLTNQLEDLKRYRPDYNYVGVARDDGKAAGEHSAIFYKADKYKVLKHGDFWMSTITNKPNKGWDAALPRICTWAKFREVKTGFTFYCFNLHMDHVGVVARRESAKLVLDTIVKMMGLAPVILMGDFNVDQRDTSYSLIQHSGFLRDAFTLAANKIWTDGTFNNFDTTRHSDSRIDHIFLSHAFAVSKYTIPVINYYDTVADNFGAGQEKKLIRRFESDHNPVVVQIEY